MHRHGAEQLIELATRIFGDREKARHWLDDDDRLRGRGD